MAKEEESGSFADLVRDLRGHIRAYRDGSLDQEGLLTLIDVTTWKMKLVSDKTMAALERITDEF